VAFFAWIATASITTNFGYFIPIVAPQTLRKRDFRLAKCHLGKWSLPLAAIAGLYICFLFVVLDLPQVYRVTAQTLNYAPIMIGGVTVLSIVGWILPFGLGGRHWFEGPRRTISEQRFSRAQVVGDKE
jgi:amino acid transporter